MPIRESLRVGKIEILNFKAPPGKKYLLHDGPIDDALVEGRLVFCEGKTKVRVLEYETIIISSNLPGQPPKTSTLKGQEINKIPIIPSIIPGINRTLVWKP